MRYLTSTLFTGATLFLCWFLDGKHFSGVDLAFGRFLDPFHGFWQNAEGKDAFQNQQLEMEGLEGPVTVVYDQERVPHIFAENNRDLYFAQGYVTARDRLWQMDFQTRATAGRLSELLNDPRVLNMDRQARRRGMVEAAQSALDTLQQMPDIVMLMDAYTAGINHYLEGLDFSDYPFEYKLLDYQPEPWTNLKCMFLLKAMAWKLTGRFREFENTNTVAAFGWEDFKSHFLKFGDSISPIIPKGSSWAFDTTAIPIPRKPGDSLPLKVLPQLKWGQPHPNNGSNNWAVHGSKTASGHPILCNDPHLGLSFPSIWYEIQLHSPQQNVIGVSLPGAPGVIIGFNRDVAWGITNSARDVLDWYTIEFKNAQRKEYKSGTAWKPVREVVHTIQVRGQDPVVDTVLWTEHGPVVFDRNFGDPNRKFPPNLAMKWTGHDPGLELLTVFRMNAARNYRDYREALQDFQCPGQNFVFACRSGDIAITQQGKFVNRWEGQGQFILDGSNPDHRWQGFIPSPHNPHVLNPPRGFVSSANQHPTDPSYPYLTHGTYDYTRGKRINQVLNGMEKITVADMMDLQLDQYHLLAGEVLPQLLPSIPEEALTPQALTGFRILQKWEFQNEADQAAPVYFEQLCRDLIEVLWEGKYMQEGQDLRVPNLCYSLHWLTEALEDKSKREAHVDMLVRAFNQMGESLLIWQSHHPHLEMNWQNFNNARVVHLSRQEALGLAYLPTGGHGMSVNAVQGEHGPSWRMVVELGPNPVGYGVYPGGPSGNPGSPWYHSQIASWAAGTYHRLHLFPSVEIALPTATSTLQLQPTQP